jgi:hypothetical protein
MGTVRDRLSLSPPCQQARGLLPEVAGGRGDAVAARKSRGLAVVAGWGLLPRSWRGGRGMPGPERATRAWRGCQDSRGRPLTPSVPSGPDPGKQSERRELAFEGRELVLRARGPDFRLPTAPADGHDRVIRVLIIGVHGGRGGG